VKTSTTKLITFCKTGWGTKWKAHCRLPIQFRQTARTSALRKENNSRSLTLFSASSLQHVVLIGREKIDQRIGSINLMIPAPWFAGLFSNWAHNDAKLACCAKACKSRMIEWSESFIKRRVKRLILHTKDGQCRQETARYCKIILPRLVLLRNPRHTRSCKFPSGINVHNVHLHKMKRSIVN